MSKMLNTDRFKEIERDPTRPIEQKLQSLLRKIKLNLPENTYSKLYPTGSFMDLQKFIN